MNRAPKFQKPELSEVKLQSAKIGLPDVEAEKFFYYFESNGWKVGRSPMVSWHAALSNWKIRLQSYRPGNRPVAVKPPAESLF